MALGIRAKLLAGFGAVLLLLGGVGGWVTLQLQRQDAAYGALVSGEAHASMLAQEIRAEMLLAVQAVKNTWLRGADPKAFEKHTKDF